MSDYKKNYQLMQNASRLFYPLYRDAVTDTLQKSGMGSQDWIHCFMAWAIEPQPLTVEICKQITPYTASVKHQEYLEERVQNNFLTKVEGGYLLSPAGKSTMTNFWESAAAALETYAPIAPEKMATLAQLLGKTVAHTESDAAYSKPFFQMSRRSDPGKDAPSIILIDQYLTDFIRLRDDAHIAAWKPLEATGAEWEALTNIWRGDRNSAKALAEFYAGRGVGEDGYAAALSTLQERGWVAKENGQDDFAISEAGRQLREGAEAQTDFNFFIGWQILTATEKSQLIELLMALEAGLKQLYAGKIIQIGRELERILFQFYRQAGQQTLENAGISHPDFFAAHLTISHDPHPFSASAYHKLYPYNSLKNRQELLASAEKGGFIQADGEHAYRPTKSGRKALADFLEATWHEMAKIELLSDAQMNQLVELWHKVETAVRAAEEPEYKAHLTLNDAAAPPESASPIAKLDQTLANLLNFRDSAHIGAWSSHKLAGYMWETFSDIWQNNGVTAASMAESRQYRGHTAQEYQVGLAELAKRGWIRQEGDKFILTEKGREVREAAESETDRLYYLGWQALSAQELGQLEAVTIQLRDKLRQLRADALAKSGSDLNQLFGKLSQAIGTLVQPALAPMWEDAGILKPALPFSLLQLASFDPAPISGETINRRFPYGKAERWDVLFEALAGKGLAHQLSDGYTISDKGRACLTGVLNAFSNHLTQVEKQLEMPKEKLERLEQLLGVMIQSALQMGDPPGAWCVRHSHNHFNPEYATLAKIDLYLDDLNAYRDDAHLASFKDLAIPGNSWELFTDMWRGDFEDIPQYAQKRAIRSYDETEYQTALDDLTDRGWVAVNGAGGVELTNDGVSVRQEAENLTDRYFFSAWATMPDNEIGEIRELLTQLLANLQALVPKTN